MLKDISMMRLDLPGDFIIGLGTADKGVKYDKAKFDKLKGAFCNTVLELPILGPLAWKYFCGEVHVKGLHEPKDSTFDFTKAPHVSVSASNEREIKRRRTRMGAGFARPKQAR